MSVEDDLRPAGGKTVLRRDAAALADFAPVFDRVAQAQSLQLTGAELFDAEDGLRGVRGECDWRGPGGRVEAIFDPVTDRVVALRLGEALKVPSLIAELPHLECDDALDWLTAERAGETTPVLSFGRRLEADVTLAGVEAKLEAVFDGAKRLELLLLTPPDAGPSLDDLVHLLGRDSHLEGDLRWLPEELREASLLSVARLELAFDFERGKLPARAALDVRWLGGKAWALAPGLAFPKVGNLRTRFEIDHPLEPDLRFATCGLLGDVVLDEAPADRIEVAAEWPDLRVHGRLAPGGSVGLAPLLRRVGLPARAIPHGDDAPALTGLEFSARPTGKAKRFAISAELEGLLEIPLGAAGKIELEGLSLSAFWAEGGGAGGFMQARLAVPGGRHVLLGASALGDEWLFTGRLEVEPGGEPLRVGEWLDHWAKKLGAGLNLPGQARGFVIDRVDVEYALHAGRLRFGLDCRAPVAPGQALDASLELEVAPAAAQGWNVEAQGTIDVAGTRFDLVFDRTGEPGEPAANDLVAVLSLDEPRGLSLRDVAAALGHAGGPDASIDVSAAAFALLSTNDAKLFALDVGAGVDLADLPLVGPVIGEAGGLAFAFQLTYASADLTKAEQSALDTINGLLPPRSVPLPPAEKIKASFGLKTSVLAAGDEIEVTLPIKAGGDGEPEHDPAGPPPPAAEDGVKWVKLDKTFGPAHFRRLGVAYKDERLRFLLDADLSLGPVTFSTTGLRVETPIWPIRPSFGLDGLGLSYASGPVSIAGAFLHEVRDGIDEFAGGATIRSEELTLSAIGAYADDHGRKSLFVYAVLDYPLGGPAFFFAEGLAAGFGFNRALEMPPASKVKSFPLVAKAVGGMDAAADLGTELREIREALPVAYDRYFLAAGIKFNSFKLIDSFALLAVQFGKRVEIDLLGLSRLVLPTPVPGAKATPLAVIEVGLAAAFLPEEGVLRVDARLTDGCYVLDKNCKLSGGFSFCAWFKGARAGEFVASLGGYHPLFSPPDDYPRPPRLGLNWPIDARTSFKGDLYCALTPHAMMAGGHLEALYDDGAAKAWFKLGCDLLMAWKPNFYDIKAYVDVGGSYTFDFLGTHTVTIDVGADLHVWGPEFAGTATIHLYVCSFDVAFGKPGGPSVDPIDWPTFEASFLPAANAVVSATFTSGVLRTREDDTGTITEVTPNALSLATDSAVPVKSIVLNGDEVDMRRFELATDTGGEKPVPDFGVAPAAVGASSFTSELKVTIEGHPALGPAFDPSEHLKIRLRAKKSPKALWGNELLPDGNDLQNAFVGWTICGIDVEPLAPHAPAHSRKIPRDKMIAGHDSEPVTLVSEPVVGRDLSSEDEAERYRLVDAALGNESVAAKRAALAAAFGLDKGALFVPPGTADSFRFAPAVFEREGAL